MTSTIPGYAPRLRPLPPHRAGYHAVLDVGTSKIAAMIARLDPPAGGAGAHRVRVVGLGIQRSRGIKAGHIVEMAAAEGAIHAAVEAAERMAGTTVEQVVVACHAGRLASVVTEAEIGIGGRTISGRDVDRVLSLALAGQPARGRVIIHALPVGFHLDGEAGVRDPRGMVAHRLTARTLVGSADETVVANLRLAIERGHIAVGGVVASPYAAALATLEADDADLGAVVIDCGAGTTSAAVFAGGVLQHLDAIAIGGQHVTLDLARGLGLRFDDAERLKIVAGACAHGTAEEREPVALPRAQDGEGSTSKIVPRGQITRIIRPRVEETLELLRDRLRAAGCGTLLSRQVIVTGGAAQLAGLPRLAQDMLAREVRLARPRALDGLPEAAGNPAFAAVAGLILQHAVAEQEHWPHGRFGEGAQGTSYLARVGRWLRESF